MFLFFVVGGAARHLALYRAFPDHARHRGAAP